VKIQQKRGQLLSCKDVRLEIDGRIILAGCSLVLEQGELVALVGPNGAGKTSMLRTILGAVAATGEVTSNEKRLASLTPIERAQQIAYLPQNGQIHWPMPVRDIVALGRLPYAGSTNDTSKVSHDMVESALAQCQITHLENRNAATLSGGERARVLLARAIVTRSKILLADEPLGSLDPAHQLDTMKSLREYTLNGSGVIVVMHDIAMGVRFADRVIVMHQGRIVADGEGGKLLRAGILDQIFGVVFTPLFDSSGILAGITTSPLVQNNDNRGR
jgi:iron complex transport system ATP-binding protein